MRIIQLIPLIKKRLHFCVSLNKCGEDEQKNITYIVVAYYTTNLNFITFDKHN